MSIDDDILKHYGSGVESDRLFTGVSQLERVRTQEIILRYLRKLPLKILDVGGAIGFYSFWLSDMGHEVHLIDPVPNHIHEARNISKKSGESLASITIGEARDLKFEDSYFDVVLLLGPLYHLTEKKERIRALSEARRCLRQGGLLFVAGISRYASMLDGYFRNFVKDPEFVEIMNRDLKDGQHRNPTNATHYFTTAYLHRPEDLGGEILETGFELEALLPIDSFGWLIPDFDEKWQNAQFRELLLQSIRACENESSLIGLSAHIMSVARKK